MPDRSTEAMAIRRARRQNPLRRILPAAIHELARLDGAQPTAAAAARNIAKRWLDLVGLHPDLQDPIRSIRRAQRRMSPNARRADLLTEARSMLQNEALNRQLPVPGMAVAIPNQRTVAQMREAIRALASQPYREVDEQFLMNYFTDQKIQIALDGNIGADEIDADLVQEAEGLYRALGI